MNANRQTTVIQGNNKERTMKITASNLIRWAGLAAMVAGIIFAGIQPIHPPDVLASVTTSAWAIITSLKTAMCLFGLLGIAGLYARQVEKTGWLGLAGYLLLSLFCAAPDGFVIRRSLYLAAVGDRGAEVCGGLSWGCRSGAASEMNLGALPAVYSLVSGRCICSAACCLASRRSAPASCRAGRPACLPFGACWPPGCAASAPVRAAGGGADGVSSGLAGLCALVGTARAQPAEPVPGRASPQLRQTAAE